jgi:hypothetical protein
MTSPETDAGASDWANVMVNGNAKERQLQNPVFP